MTRTTACWALTCSLHARKKFAARATFVSGPFVRHFLARGFTASDAPRISARRPSRPPAWFSNDIRPRRVTPARHVPPACRGGRTEAARAFSVSPSSLSSCAWRPARHEGSGKVQARAAARTRTATKVRCVPAECVANILDGTTCKTAHSARWKPQTCTVGRTVDIAQSARRVLRPTTADAGRYVTAQRSTEVTPTIALRREMRVHLAIAATDACLGSAARTTIVATATQGKLMKMDITALIAHRVTELVQRAAPVHSLHPANV